MNASTPTVFSTSNPDENELETVTRESFIQNSFGDRYLYSVNRHAFDRFGARHTFDLAFKDTLRAEDTLYIIAGSDSGLLYEYVHDLPRPAGSRYLFVELENIHALLLNEDRCQHDDASIRCAASSRWLEEASALQIHEYLYLDAVKVVLSVAAQDQHHPEYTELAWQLKEEVDKLRWQAVAQLGDEAFIICQLQNAADNIQSAHILRQAFAEKTAVLLAGGPSLDELLPWVIQHRDKLAVLAVSRIAARLLETGITPDFIFSVDPTELSYDISKPMLALDARTTLIHQYHVAPRLLAQWPHRSLYLGELLPWTSKLNASAPLSAPGPTVTNTALQIAFDMGFRTIILGGVDLCFTQEGYTHALGSNERAAGPRFDLTHLEVETYAGDKATTTPDFATAIETLGNQARYLAANGCTLINPSPGAARIDTIQHLPQEDLPVPTESIDISTTLASLLPASDEKQRLVHYQELEREFSRIQHELEIMRSLIKEAIRINDSMFNPNSGLIESGKSKKKLDRIEKTLSKKHGHLSLIVKRMGLRALLRAMRPFMDYETMSAEDTRTIGHDYYAAYLSGTERLMAILKEAEQRLKLRIREEEANTPLAEMAEGWRRDTVPGRIRVWAQRHPDRIITLTLEEQALREALEREFEQDLARKHTVHMQRAQAHADLGAARIRARQLFSQRKIDALKGLMIALKKHHNHTQGRPFMLLVEGYLHELEGNMASALDAYAQVLEHGDLRLSEDALLRMTNWSLDQGQVEQALHALQCLASISEQYTLQYAEMLRIAGDPIQAVEAYQRHIERFPDDSHAKLRLAKHLIDHQAYEGALLVLDHMLGDKANEQGVQAMRKALETAMQGSLGHPHPPS
jgi:tetratricopeptide (TPR) repeat protein